MLKSRSFWASSWTLYTGQPWLRLPFTKSWPSTIEMLFNAFILPYNLELLVYYCKDPSNNFNIPYTFDGENSAYKMSDPDTLTIKYTCSKSGVVLFGYFTIMLWFLAKKVSKHFSPRFAPPAQLFYTTPLFHISWKRPWCICAYYDHLKLKIWFAYQLYNQNDTAFITKALHNITSLQDTLKRNNTFLLSIFNYYLKSASNYNVWLLLI